MVAIVREGGFRFVVYPNDHLPPHVHVYGPGRARIALLTNGVEMLSSRDTAIADTRKALDIAERYREALTEAWRRLHG